MNIVFFLPSVKNKGGVERALISLLNTLVLNKSHKIFLFVFNYIGQYLNMNIPVNVWTILIVGCLKIPGAIVLVLFGLW